MNKIQKRQKTVHNVEQSAKKKKLLRQVIFFSSLVHNFLFFPRVSFISHQRHTHFSEAADSCLRFPTQQKKKEKNLRLLS